MIEMATSIEELDSVKDSDIAPTQSDKYASEVAALGASGALGPPEPEELEASPERPGQPIQMTPQSVQPIPQERMNISIPQLPEPGLLDTPTWDELQPPLVCTMIFLLISTSGTRTAITKLVPGTFMEDGTLSGIGATVSAACMIALSLLGMRTLKLALTS